MAEVGVVREAAARAVPWIDAPRAWLLRDLETAAIVKAGPSVYEIACPTLREEHRVVTVIYDDVMIVLVPGDLGAACHAAPV